MLSMKLGVRALFCIFTFLWIASFAIAAQDAPGFVGKHQNDVAEKAAIEHVLSVYTTSLSSGNEAIFASIFLNDRVPFASTAELKLADADSAQLQMNRYAAFKRVVFESGRHFEQKFYNVHIEQDGALAQVSLDFLTKEVGAHGGTYGWKSLTLLKVSGQWKIASELYTAYSLSH